MHVPGVKPDLHDEKICAKCSLRKPTKYWLEQLSSVYTLNEKSDFYSSQTYIINREGKGTEFAHVQYRCLKVWLEEISNSFENAQAKLISYQA